MPTNETQEARRAAKKAAYEQSALKQLMDATGHEVCKRCYCCDSTVESFPCWSCGVVEEENDWDDWGNFCQECGGEGELFDTVCIGNCDENGEHKAVSTGEHLGRDPQQAKVSGDEA